MFAQKTQKRVALGSCARVFSPEKKEKKNRLLCLLLVKFCLWLIYEEN
jgi:hypothetical protein